MKNTKQKIIFKKAYSRNFSIIMKQAWFVAKEEKLIERFGFNECLCGPPCIFYMKEGMGETWENVKVKRWFLDNLIKKLRLDKKFFPKFCKMYLKKLVKIKIWWDKDIKNIKDLKKFIDKAYECVSDFAIIYTAMMDSNIPQECQELAFEMRKNDVLFENCSETILRALRNIYPKLGCFACYVTREDLEKKINKEELEKRDKGFALIPGIFRGIISFEDLAKRFPEYYFEIEKGEQDKNGLKGQIAFQGKVVGNVRIVKRKDQIAQVIDGEIIVSPMTTPDFISAMRRASAFITDEGGITCHAAIIARELKKPCIIGTKIATKVLKDGDLIEVDANKGVVKIIKRAK